MKEPYEVVQKVEDQSSAVKRAMIDAMPMGAHPAAVIFALNDLAGDSRRPATSLRNCASCTACARVARPARWPRSKK